MTDVAEPAIDQAQAPSENGAKEAKETALTLRTVSEHPELVPAVPHGLERTSWALLPQAAMLARMVARTSFVPASFRNKPDSIAAAMLLGHELGLSPMIALRNLHATDAYVDAKGREKGGEILMAAQLMRAVARKGGCRLWTTEYNSGAVTWAGHRRGEEETVERVRWTLDMAKGAGLIKQDSAWQKFPRAMLSARASAELCRLIAEDVLAGIYAMEEGLDTVRALEELLPGIPGTENGDEPPPGEPPPGDGTRTRSLSRRNRSTPVQAVTEAKPAAPEAAAPADAPATTSAPDIHAATAAAPAEPQWSRLPVPGDNAARDDRGAAGTEEPAAEATGAAPSAAPPPPEETQRQQAPVEPQPRPAPTAPPGPSRKLITQVVLASKDAGLDDTGRHDVIRAVTNDRVSNSSAMTQEEAQRVLLALRQLTSGESVMRYDALGKPLIEAVADDDLRDHVITRLKQLQQTGAGATGPLLTTLGWNGVQVINEWVAGLARPQVVAVLEATRAKLKEVESK